MTLTMDTIAVRDETLTAAAAAAHDYIAEWKAKTGGNAYGEPMYCGFAWVTVYPRHKGNTRLGKLERQTLKEIGLRPDYTGRAYELWNPAQWPGPKVLTKYGYTAYAGSRAD